MNGIQAAAPRTLNLVVGMRPSRTPLKLKAAGLSPEDTYMPITFVDVSTYLVFAYGGPGGNAGADATISLGIPNAFASLQFYPEAAPLPPNSKATHVSGNPIFYVSYRYAQLANVLDLLRNEKPIRFFFRDDNLASYITTSAEPVGEGES